MSLILASQSAVRASLLRAAGLTFETASPGVDEDAVKAAHPGAPPREIAAILADKKALAIAAYGRTDALVIGADQTLEYDGRLFDKAQSIEEARARLKNALTAPRQVAVAEEQVKVLQAEVKQAKVAVDLARTDLQRTKVYAPVDGTVSKKAVLPGGYVNTGSPILALVQDGVWVVANFKETQMTRIRPGLNVVVEVDSYPGKIFKGRVDSIQPGTGARFSLLPPENAAGSFVKVVQRIPVKIVLDDPNQFTDSPLRPGMSVEATVTL